MSYIPSLTFDPMQATLDAGARVRVSFPNTLGDYKILNYIKQYQYSYITTSTISSGLTGADQNMFHQYVGPGEYWITQTRQHHAYLAGKSQLIEMTFDNFAPQSGIIKRFGYFSGGRDASPYTDNLDGIFLESSNGVVTFNIYNNGVSHYAKEMSQWVGYSQLQDYDWNMFNVMIIDFLWLGGAVVRLYFKTAQGFILADTFTHAQTMSGTMTQSPNQPLRVDLISTGGSGDTRIICATVATEGSPTAAGYTRYVNSVPTGRTMSSVGTKQVLLAARRNPNMHDQALKLSDLFISTRTTDDQIFWTVELNPVVDGATLTWVSLDDSAVQYAYGLDENVIGLSGSGIVLASGVLGYNQVLPSGVIKDSFLSWMGGALDGTQDRIVLTVTPLLGNSTVVGGMALTEL